MRDSKKIIRPVDKGDTRPRHKQVQEILRSLVESGHWQPSEKIPSEVQLATLLSVSKMTVNKAILALTDDGLFVRQVGRGTYVRAFDSPPGAGRRPFRIGIAYSDGRNPIEDSFYYGELYRGMRDALAESVAAGAVSVALVPLDVNPDFRLADDRKPCDGWLIIAPRLQSLPSIEALRAQGRRIVVVGASWPDATTPTVDSDNTGGAMLAVGHLAALGHRRIALVYSEPETANTRDRIRGYRRALDDLGLPREPALEVRSEWMWKLENSARTHLTSLLRHRTDPVTAVFGAGFYLGWEAINVARELGLGVPDPIAVVGYDDPYAAQLIQPPLTTLRQPLAEMGRRAVERLLALSDAAEPEATRDVVAADLIVRGSAPAVTDRASSDPRPRR